MATKTLSNDFMQRIADEGAWKEDYLNNLVI